ncbi:IS21 family transposase [Enterobacter mori]|uniref:IS21 family transposase n=1 Tax=Enterobacter mori TaxID=539813 RepID=UPI003B98405F
MKRKGMTKILLWQEYQQVAGENAYGYSQFCNLYNDWLKLQKRSMRQHHVAGEKLFLDFCGPTIPIVNPDTGEVRQAQIFVATLGASNYTYVEACENQRQESWLMAHTRAFEFFGGVPLLLVPDNLKSAVTHADRYEPVLNENYRKLARYYNTAVLPARPRKPKDKPKVENAVQVVERWILMRLRHEVFHTLAALNLAISELLQDLNERPFRRLSGCRKSQFEQLDKPALKALPPYPYEYVDIRRAKVGPDYHVLYGKHAYSVPHALVGSHIDIEAGARLVRLYHKGILVAQHPRALQQGASPRRQTICRSLTASNGGVRTGCCHGVRVSAAPPGQWWPGICITVPTLSRLTGPTWGCSISAANMERRSSNSACQQALLLERPWRQVILNLLKNHRDRQQDDTPDDTPVEHSNVRGAGYYHGGKKDAKQPAGTDTRPATGAHE